jgi:hypothetical protein
MATKLTKAIKRELFSTEQHGKHRGKPFIVELIPGDEISFRVKGTKKSYSVYLGHCLRMAKILTMESEYKEKLKVFSEKKKAGLRAKKPNRPSMPFNKMYFDAINKR